MNEDRQGRQYLLYGSLAVAMLTGLAAVVVSSSVSLLGQSLTVFGFAPTLQAGIAVLFFVSIVIIMKLTFGGYTDRATDVALADPRGIMWTGVKSAVLVLSPYVVLTVVMLLLDAVGLISLALLTVLAIPLVWITLTAAAVGLVSIGRMASDKEGVVLLVVASIAVPVGAFPVPFGIVGVGVTVLGFGAIIWDMRYGESEFESQDRESYGKQHRYL
ncbi:MAG: hypothetical protein J07HX64_00117 [halophilic archaeon J07HX64]|jgi:hypothetical protein|nr:MAG: hypothetical protein J07HX64_00117 [halophilic archaeon J07HX64]